MEKIAIDKNYHKSLTDRYGSLEAYLSDVFAEIFEKLKFDPKHAKIHISSRPELSHFQCNGAMQLAKEEKTSPLELAERIVKHLIGKPLFEKIEVFRPGFINITLTKTFITDWINATSRSERLGCKKADSPTKIVFDFGGPNIAKPLHIGHLRSPLIGECLQRVYRFYGNDVLSDVHLGDWGTQMGMLIEEVRKMKPNLPYFDLDYSGDYPENSPVTVDDLSEIYPRASERCREDHNNLKKARLATLDLQKGRRGYLALWRHLINVSVRELKKDYAELRVNFDLWKGESDVQYLVRDMVSGALENSVAKKSQGAVIVPIAKNENDKTPPLILVKSDGAVMYATTDLATILERVKHQGARKIIYIVDKRQSLHFKQVFLAAKKIGIAKDTELVHVGFGTLNGKNGKPFKTRSGGVMRLSTLINKARARVELRSVERSSKDNYEEIVNKVALAIIKFADLSNVCTSDYAFDLDKFAQYEGKTGPYLLYSAVRIKSILRRTKIVKQLEIQPASNELELKLQLILTSLPNAVEKSYRRCEPHHLCDYIYQVSSAFNRFYAVSPISSEINRKIKAARVALCQLTLRHFKLVLWLLGIEIPEKM